MSEDDRPTVLVADDEENVLEAYALWLSDEYDVRTAHDGQEALEQMDDDVDVVLLDRRMPRISGDDALEAFREKGYEARVAMVTAVDPDYDIVEMDFDDYLTKPVSREELVETVDELLILASYDDAVREEFSLAKKQAALESQKTQIELEDSDDYQRFTAQREHLQGKIDQTLEEMDDETFKVALSDLPGDRDLT